MKVVDLIRRIAGKKEESREVVGTIISGPVSAPGGGTTRSAQVFRLDSRPDLEFRQEISPLESEHRRGDRVRVHYHLTKEGVAVVEWIESAEVRPAPRG